MSSIASKGDCAHSNSIVVSPSTESFSDHRISESIRYINELNWRLVPVLGHGDDPKKPMFKGWPDYSPSCNDFISILEFHGEAQVGINLGGSGLIDLEGDSDEAEMILDELCTGLDFPYWASSRGKHRLFQAGDVGHLDINNLKIEFRTGRHQSILPPSIIEDTQYRWIVSPFEVSPPPLPQRIIEFHAHHAQNRKNKRERSSSTAQKQRWPYRDKFDYVLRHYDLLEEARKAGVEFVASQPDVNGNIPCYVPDELRDDNPDDHPSGVFNVFNGTLRDFATDENHLFFNILSKLTGERWQDIFDRYEAKCGARTGRPHSFRVSYPTDELSDTERRLLADARADLIRYYNEQLSRPHQPKTVHLIKGPPGVGKTWNFCELIGKKKKKAIILTLEKKLAKSHLENIVNLGDGSARRMPILRDMDCPHPEEYEATSRRGFKASQSFPCRKCSIGPKNCPYLLDFSSLSDADQLCGPAIYHTHDDFYLSHGNEDRPILVFDENSIDFLLEPISNTLDQWRSWADMIRRKKKTKDSSLNSHTNDLLALVEWLEQIGQEFLFTSDENAQPLKFKPELLPDDLHRPDIAKLPSLQSWLNRSACKKENQSVQNLYTAAIYLLKTPDSHVILERIRKDDGDVVKVRFRKKNPVPDDKEVFILDATANEQLVRAVFPGWDFHVWECPPLEQKGRVVQIMDYDISRSRIKKEVSNHQDHNPSWLVQVFNHILAEHGPMPIITFKDVIDGSKPEMDILSLLADQNRITDKYNFPCRGHNIESDNLLVLGTPYKDEAVFWELALAIWGFDGLPAADYGHQKRKNSYFISKNMGFAEERLLPIEEFVVSADLVQAIGRVRPLQNDCTVFVVSNAPITDWEVEQFTASELFDMRLPNRKDFADSYQRFCDETNRQLHEHGSAKSSDVCRELEINLRTGRNYMKQYKDDHKETITEKGHSIMLKS